MMRFMAFTEIQLNPCMRDIGDCQWAKPTHRATITHTDTHRAYISVWVPRKTHPQRMSLDISTITPVLSKPSISLNPLYLSCLDLIEFPGKP
jgi:hypothetical protein